MLQKNNKSTLAQEIYKELISIIKSTRKNKGLSQSNIAGHLSISYQQYQKYESGKDILSTPVMIDICMILNLDVSMVFTLAKNKVNLTQDKGEG